MILFRIIGSILKFIWKAINFVREIILNLVFLLVIIVIFGTWGLMSQQQELNQMTQDGILVLDIQGHIVDTNAQDDEFYQLRNKLYGDQIDLNRSNSLFELTQKISQATTDKRIKAIILKLDHFTGGDLPSLQYIGKYLSSFSDAKKTIYAIAGHYNQSQYYLASFANKVYLKPQGAVSLYGFSANNLYYKSLLENLKVDTHVFRVGTYKSAVEPFIRDNMSNESKQNTQRWLNTMWESYLNDIENNREYFTNTLVPDVDTLLANIKSAGGSMSEYALNNQLVDKVTPAYLFERDINRTFGDIQQISIYDYSLKPAEISDINKPEIATIFVNGAIVDGSSSENTAGSYTIAKQLNEILNSPTTKAVVVRINSPGGSVTASEEIRNALEAIRLKNIPVVVSMGGMAASGGYWIATESDYIVSSANTITGSIGIFGVIPTFENSLSHIGVYSDGVSTSPLADINVTKKLPTEFVDLMQMNIENGYQSFIKIVANARGLSTSEVDAVAQGQVWLGSEAHKLKLVDEIGDFDVAITKAAELANISHNYQINWLKPKTSWFSSAISNISGALPKSMIEIIYPSLPLSQEIKQHISFWDNLTDAQNRYAYCLNCADVL